MTVAGRMGQRKIPFQPPRFRLFASSCAFLCSLLRAGLSRPLGQTRYGPHHACAGRPDECSSCSCVSPVDAALRRAEHKVAVVERDPVVWALTLPSARPSWPSRSCGSGSQSSSSSTAGQRRVGSGNRPPLSCSAETSSRHVSGISSLLDTSHTTRGAQGFFCCAACVAPGCQLISCRGDWRLP